jgi:hypothetical protein
MDHPTGAGQLYAPPSETGSVVELPITLGDPMKRFTRRSANIFSDAEYQEVKAPLVLGIAKLIEARGITKA